MKSNKIFLLSFMLMMGVLGASAQEQPKTEEAFNPHWYLQAQVGGQYTLGEINFGDLMSFNAQIGAGYQFNPVFGTRLTINAFQSKAGSTFGDVTYKWNWNYIAPALDATFDLTNLIGGYKYNRVCNVGIFAGIGGNFRLGEGNAAEANAAILAANPTFTSDPLGYLDDAANASFLGHAGLMVDFRLSDRVNLGLELSANGVSDKYNYKAAGNIDWYFNGLVGIKVALGKNGTHTTKVIPAPVPVERVVEKVVEVQVPCPEAPAAQAVLEPIRRDIFFSINSSVVTQKQMSKVMEIAQYLNENPAAKVAVSGYADAKTGTKAINARIAKNRAQAVADVLVKKFNIASSRISINSFGSDVQPFADNASNRVCIAVTE